MKTDSVTQHQVTFDVHREAIIMLTLTIPKRAEQCGGSQHVTCSVHLRPPTEMGGSRLRSGVPAQICIDCSSCPFRQTAVMRVSLLLCQINSKGQYMYIILFMCMMQTSHISEGIHFHPWRRVPEFIVDVNFFRNYWRVQNN